VAEITSFLSGSEQTHDKNFFEKISESKPGKEFQKTQTTDRNVF